MSEIDWQRRQDHQQRAMFEDYIEHFLKRYDGFIPEDERHEYHANLHSLVRLIYHDAQAPVMRHMEKMLAGIAAVSPIIFPKRPAQSGESK